MKVLVTGNQGYIGSVLTEFLQACGHGVVGFDAGYYDGCELYPRAEAVRQINKDIRNVSGEDFDGIEAVIHLAALSNDPLGELEPRLTEEINLMAAARLARLAREAGGKRFIDRKSG